MRIVGVLNDFDLISRVVSVGNQEPSSKHRTGTKPFMAIDLLSDNPPHHLYRHDLESLFYVMLWHTHRYEGGRISDSDNLEYDKWATQSVEKVFNLKHALIHGQKALSAPLPQHAKLEDLLSFYRLALMEGLAARSSHVQRQELMLDANPEAARKMTFDDETLGGRLSFDAVADIFVTCAPR